MAVDIVPIEESHIDGFQTVGNRFLIASEAKQSISRVAKLECFVANAPRNDKQSLTAACRTPRRAR
jgi:hypothetical protein